MALYKNIRIAELREKLDKDIDYELIDVRMERDFKKDHVAGAINIPFIEVEKFAKLRKDKSYYLYCGSGGKSAIWLISCQIRATTRYIVLVARIKN